MADHYYTDKPGSAHAYHIITAEYFGRVFRFKTDSGVFSRAHIDPGSDLLLRSIGTLEGRVVDMGCGWGALGIPLAYKNEACRIEMIDVNARAIDLCKENIGSNKILNACAQTGDGFSQVEAGIGSVVMNPPVRIGKPAMYALFAQAYEKLAQSGSLTIVLRKQQGAESTQAYLTQLFGNCTRIAREKGYWILQSQK